uniref:Uncharacterized protein n=1 Tax=Eutreptiella gymnastica TaxID=73025 RepID=A0A7S4GGD0_9EUGL
MGRDHMKNSPSTSHPALHWEKGIGSHAQMKQKAFGTQFRELQQIAVAGTRIPLALGCRATDLAGDVHFVLAPGGGCRQFQRWRLPNCACCKGGDWVNAYLKPNMGLVTIWANPVTYN